MTISLQFATYSAFESDLMEEVCVFVDGTSLPSGRVVQYRIQTVDQTALGKLYIDEVADLGILVC